MCNTVSKVENCGNKVIKLGSGTYGTVYLYNGGKYKTKIALKKMKIDDKYICDGYIRDVIILRSVSGKGWNNQKFYKYKSKKSQQSHPNIISLFDAFFEQDVLYMVTPYFGSCLSEYISTPNRERASVKEIIYQIISGIAYLHSFGIIHRDLTPSNILLVNGMVKIIDFSLSKRSLGELENVNNTPKLCSLWYRAPELTLGSTQYDFKVDVWSIGCILSSMVKGTVVFNLSTVEDMICRLIDTYESIDRNIYSDKELEHWNIYEKNKNKAKNNFYLFDNRFNPKTYSDYPLRDEMDYILDNEFCFDFIKRLLALNPKERISAKAALDHPFIKDVRHKEYEKLYSFEEQLNTRLPLYNTEENFEHISEYTIFIRSKCLYRMMEIYFDLEIHPNTYFLMTIILNRYMLEYPEKVQNSTIYKIALIILNITCKLNDRYNLDLSKLTSIFKLKYDEKIYYEKEKEILTDLSFDIDYSTTYDYLHLKCPPDLLNKATEIAAYISTTQLGFVRPDKLADYVIEQVNDPNSEWMKIVYEEHSDNSGDDEEERNKFFNSDIH